MNVVDSANNYVMCFVYVYDFYIISPLSLDFVGLFSYNNKLLEILYVYYLFNDYLERR